VRFDVFLDLFRFGIGTPSHKLLKTLYRSPFDEIGELVRGLRVLSAANFLQISLR